MHCHHCNERIGYARRSDSLFCSQKCATGWHNRNNKKLQEIGKLVERRAARGDEHAAAFIAEASAS